MRLLKQSTATTLLLGPFVDSTDGFTSETALPITQADVLLWKEGGTTLAQKNDTNSPVHRSNGLYTCAVNSTDTNTLGILTVSVSESGALPVRHDFYVVPANVYDSLVLGTDLIQVDVQQNAGSAITAASGRQEVNVSHFGGSAGTFASGRPEVNTTHFGGTAGTFASGRPEVNTTHAAGTAWGSGAITAASIASDAITAAKIATGAITSAKFAAGAIDAAAIADNAIDAGAIASSAITDTKIASGAITSAKFAAGAINAAAIATDAIDADAISSDAITEIQAGNPLVLRTGTCAGGASGSITLDGSASAVTDFYKGNIVSINGGTGAGQSRLITAYNGGTKVATVNTSWATNPVNASSVFQILAFGSNVLYQLETAMEADGGVFRYTTNALEQGPAGGGGGSGLSSVLDNGTATAGTSSSITLALAASATSNAYKFSVVGIRAGTGKGQSRCIMSYNGGTKVASVEPDFDITPDATSEYIITPFGTEPALLEDVVTAVWAADRASNNAVGSFGEYVNADITSVSGDTTAATNMEAAFDGTGYTFTNVFFPWNPAWIGAELTAVPWNAAWDAEVQSEVADGLLAYTAVTVAYLDSRTVPSANYAATAQLTSIETDTQDIQQRLPSSLDNGRMRAKIEQITDVILTQGGTGGQSIGGT